jgi:alkaline phosphatase D
MITFNRRLILKGLAGSALLSIGGVPLLSRGVWPNPIFRHHPFSLGIASGDPTPTGVVLWTRLAPEPFDGGGMPNKAVEVQWQVAATIG